MLRQQRDVRAGRRGELGLTDRHRRRHHGAAASPQRPHGPAARRFDLAPPLGGDEWAGPGESRVGYGEYNQRHLMNRWADFIEAGPSRRPTSVSAPEDGTVPSDRAHPHHLRRQPLGARATPAVPVGDPLPFSDPVHLAAHQWLVDEAYLLDRQDLERWLARMTEDVHYFMPIRVTTSQGAPTTPPGGWRTSTRTSTPWSAGSPGCAPSTPGPRTRPHGCATTCPTCAPSRPTCPVRSSWNRRYCSSAAVATSTSRPVSAGRSDVLRSVDGAWRLARRHITVDESVLRTQNLAVFL